MTASPRRSRAFTLIELIVVIVIVGVLIAALAFAYVRFANGARDQAARTQLAQIARAAAGIAATSGQVAYPTDPATLEQLFTDASSETTLIAAGPGLSAAGVTVTSSASTGYGVVSVAASADGATAGLAMKSQTGSCAVVWLTGAKIRDELWSTSDTCSGTAVATSTPGATSAGGSAPEGGGSTPTPPASTLAAPTGLSVAVAGDPCTTGDDQVTASWSTLSGATSYQLYVDGAASGAAAAGTSRTLTLTAGAHQVSVAGIDADGEGAKSSPVVARSGFNGTFATAHPIPHIAAGDVWLTANANFACGPLERETGEPGVGKRTQWWTFTPVETGTYTFSRVAPTAGTTYNPGYGTMLDVYTGESMTALTSHSRTNLEPSSGTVAPLHLIGGTTYRIQHSVYESVQATLGSYRLQINRGSAEDMFATAPLLTTPAPGAAGHTTTVNTAWANVEPSEPGDANSVRTMWWKFIPTESGTFYFTRVVPEWGSEYAYGDGMLFEVFRGTDKASLTKLSVYHNLERNVTGIPVPLVAGQTYYVKNGQYSSVGYKSGTYRIRYSRGPANDMFAVADTSLTTPAVGATSTSGNVDITYAGREDGEPSDTWKRTVWWKFTPAATGSYRFGRVSPTSGTSFPTGIGAPAAVYSGTSVDALTVVAGGQTELNNSAQTITATLTGGVTYYFRHGAYGDRDDKGSYRVTVTRIS